MAFFQKKVTEQTPICEMQTNLASGLEPALPKQKTGYEPDQDIKGKRGKIKSLMYI